MARSYRLTWGNLREARLLLFEITCVVHASADAEKIEIWDAIIEPILTEDSDGDSSLCDWLCDAAQKLGVSFSTVYRRWCELLPWIIRLMS